MLTDLRFAFRVLLKNRAFTAVVVVTMALGIGANTAIFTVINAVMFKGMPFPDRRADHGTLFGVVLDALRTE